MKGFFLHSHVQWEGRHQISHRNFFTVDGSLFLEMDEEKAGVLSASPVGVAGSCKVLLDPFRTRPVKSVDDSGNEELQK